METAARTYVLDSNVFIQAKNQYYGFDICPGFWDAVPWYHAHDRLCSIDRVKDELADGKDELADWVKSDVASHCFELTTGAEVIRIYREIMAWVNGPGGFSRDAIALFAKGADGWLVAYAKAAGHVVVTHEQLSLGAKKVKIPNVCRQFGVAWANTFEMIRDLDVQFTWHPPE